MKKGAWLCLPALLMMLVGCAQVNPGDSSSGTSSNEGSSSSPASSQSSSAAGSSSFSSEPKPEGYTVGDLAEKIAYSAAKYDKNVTSSSIVEEAKKLDSSLGEDTLANNAHIFLLSYCAFNDSIPEKKAVRIFEWHENAKDPSFADFAESSPYTTAFRFFSNLGIVDPTKYASESGYQPSALLEGDEDADLLLSRMHSYYGNSSVDDFYSYANYDQRMAAPDYSSSDAEYQANLFDYDTELSFIEGLLPHDEGSKLVYDKIMNIGQANYVGDLIKPYLEVTTISEFMALAISDHEKYGFSPLYQLCNPIVNVTDDDERFYGLQITPYILSSSFQSSKLVPGESAYEQLIKGHEPLFSLILGEEDGQKMATALAEFDHAYAVSLEQHLATYGTINTGMDFLDETFLVGDTGYNVINLMQALGVKEANKGLIVGIAIDFCKLFYGLFTQANLEALKGLATLLILRNYQAILPNTDIVNEFFSPGSSEGGGTRYDDKFYFITDVVKYFSGNLANYYISTEDCQAQFDNIITVYDDLKESMRGKISSSSWLSSDGKSKALEKIGNMKYSIVGHYSDSTKVSYNDIPYASLPSDATLLDCVHLYQTDSWDDYLAHMGLLAGDPFKLTTLGYDPFTVNAFYDPTNNSIFLTLGYLAATGDTKKMSQAQLLSRYGWTIGHEMGHGYDQNGFLYDKDGHSSPNWFSEADKAAFAKLAEEYSSYIDGYEIVADVTSSPSVILNECIADNIGVSLSLDIIAREKCCSVSDFFLEAAKLFGAYGTWYYYYSYVHFDVHPLGRARVNPVFSSMDEFHEAFNVKEGDYMYVAPEDRIIFY